MMQDPQTGTLVEDMLMLNTHTWKWFKAEVGAQRPAFTASLMKCDERLLHTSGA